MHAPSKSNASPASKSASLALNPRRHAGNGRPVFGHFHRILESGSTPAPGVADRALAVGRLRRKSSRIAGNCPCVRVFRAGAENNARGGRAPFPLPPTGCSRCQVNFSNGSENFLNASSNFLRVSKNFLGASGNFWRVSGNFLKVSKNFLSLPKNFLEGSGNFWSGSRNSWKALRNFLEASSNFWNGSKNLFSRPKNCFSR